MNTGIILTDHQIRPCLGCDSPGSSGPQAAEVRAADLLNYLIQAMGGNLTRALVDDFESGRSVSALPYTPLDRQVDGNHYTNMAIQPAEYILANELGFAEGNVVKYVSRWRNKGGVTDLEKAKHYLEMLIAKHKEE